MLFVEKFDGVAKKMFSDLEKISYTKNDVVVFGNIWVAFGPDWGWSQS